MKKRSIAVIMLAGYSAILIKVMVFKDIPTITIGSLMLNFSGTDGGSPANFVPFKTIVSYLLGDKGLIIAGINLVGNIAPLVPVGLLVPFIYRSSTWKKALVVATGTGLTLEIMQTILHVGIFDVDDVLLNALGVMIGYWACRLLTTWTRSGEYKKIALVAAALLVLPAAVLYMVYPKDNHREGPTPTSGNPCGNTMGTGTVMSVGNTSITLELNDGSLQSLTLTDRTIIRNSTGPVAASDLKAGERVTIVVEDDKTALAVLVCGISKTGAQ